MKAAAVLQLLIATPLGQRAAVDLKNQEAFQGGDLRGLSAPKNQTPAKEGKRQQLHSPLHCHRRATDKHAVVIDINWTITHYYHVFGCLSSSQMHHSCCCIKFTKEDAIIHHRCATPLHGRGATHLSINGGRIMAGPSKGTRGMGNHYLYDLCCVGRYFDICTGFCS